MCLPQTGELNETRNSLLMVSSLREQKFKVLSTEIPYTSNNYAIKQELNFIVLTYYPSIHPQWFHTLSYDLQIPLGYCLVLSGLNHVLSTVLSKTSFERTKPNPENIPYNRETFCDECTVLAVPTVTVRGMPPPVAYLGF